ncbi:bifunctional [glutamine synthetase] adenylyltransferase/[glutamine synthetase]-adenylyl-L-tyrosine phosphorylase [Streptomyces sp. ICBB 8177]|uniref:bifunctional [glutamine synthetase] adenylyltransferase/[glutamine synthetase]-adenylyl-L-tyrosine phosphorylase n=1 Tax=Streptomyces sp. ICBB 8177 TaxID=563922 RepID=UPI000D67E009|nr:bifunctional [glutamine synthetase] adenylyltransferase/[glutamine synthetase]-adenylyl-L-tyrosine phosphorylase [Streptomyces sp. ICBB 8177]PWI43306.1 bifunctional glutamine-synthetase adenylyltransferase/deadenyltransferase [Streptomyces sp. ICBB 8177]
MLEGRRSSTFSRLLRHGFTDPAAAERLLESPQLTGVRNDLVLLEALGATADPDLALLGLVRLAEALDDAERHTLLDTLITAKPLRDRLLGVLGASEALGDHLARHPRDWHSLVTYESTDLHPGVADFELALRDGMAAVTRRTGATAQNALRAAYRRCLLAIAARDVCGTSGLAETAGELADLATATLRAALAIAMEEAPADAAACRLAVIAMGKAGGHELNYVSDVDVIFVAETPDGVAEPASLQAATRLAARMMRVCSETTAEGRIWDVDANLRPEGKNGPLVRTLTSHLAYYKRWAKTWEFQALLKARPVAGDDELGAAYLDAVTPMVWQAADREHFVTDVQEMRRRVVDNIPAAHVERELKLGPGGLRDVEFAVQLLQLVHGRTDPSLRSGTTLTALRQLAEGGYVGRADAASLDAAYRFLRSMEHRIQLHRLRRTHLVPEDEADLRRLGRSLARLYGWDRAVDPVERLGREWRRHAVEVRRLHEKLFYRPLLDAVAQLEPGEARLSPDAARQRLEALGYQDPAAALRHLEALASGVSRKAAIQRTLLPVMLGWFADSADPDAGLLGFRKVSDALGRTPWYLRLLRDEGAAAENLARVLSAGRLAPDLLLRAPEAVALLGDPEGLRPRGLTALLQEVRAAVSRAGDAQGAVTAVRGVRRRELFRTAAADLTGAFHPGQDPGAAVDAVGTAVSDLTTATIAGALQAAVRAVGEGEPLPTRIAVIGMGRFGGHELGYGSDADVLFVHEPLDGVDEPDASRIALKVVNELRRLLQIPTADPPLIIDADLRPEGKSGPLVRSLASYAAYYRRWSLGWESQALLRAEPAAGDEELAARFLQLVDPLRYPRDGLTDEAVREIRRLKARMEAERLPRGADPTTHTKLGRGGLSDVEWTVQLLQMRHGHETPGLRTTRTRQALAAAREAELVDAEDAATLDEAWVLATRVRNAVMLVRGRPGDTFPGDGRELAAVARHLGYGPGRVGEMLDDYRRTTRRARAVMERLFYEYEA